VPSLHKKNRKTPAVPKKRKPAAYEHDPELKNKRIITWRDADQNLVTIAASLLAAVYLIRSYIPMTTPVHRENGDAFNPGDLDDHSNGAGFWSFQWTEEETHQPIQPSAAEDPRSQYSILCWYSFVQMIRYRLRQSRQEVEANLYTQKRALTTQVGRSRNKRGKGSHTSKFGRTKERPL
jgi:hypothetical protein